MKKLYICSVILILFFGGCYPIRKEKPSPVPEFVVDEEVQKKVKEYLAEVEKICQNNESLDVVGQSTMTQSARLIDLGKAALPMLVAVIQDKTRHWKFRYWACDLLGYIEDEGNILPLIAVIEDPSEEEKVRFCALEAIAEMNNQQAIEYLEVAEQIVENETLRMEIMKVIEKLMKGQ